MRQGERRRIGSRAEVECGRGDTGDGDAVVVGGARHQAGQGRVVVGLRQLRTAQIKGRAVSFNRRCQRARRRAVRHRAGRCAECRRICTHRASPLDRHAVRRVGHCQVHLLGR
eukprot:2280790-Prymnesium_polylepis.3